LRIANYELRILNVKSILPTLLAVLMSASSCGGGSSADWTDLPEQLSGGVVVYGDSRTGHSKHRWLMEGMGSLVPGAVFHTGDLVDDGRIEQNWITFNDIASLLPSGTPFYPSLGNHEHESSLYFENFELPGNERWYSVNNLEGLKFIVLDSGSDLAPTSSQYQWLESELAGAVSSTDFTVVTFHYPIYSTGYHGSDEKDIAGDLVPLFEGNGVDAVFNGHDHDYERSTAGGIRYIVAGGGGAPLRNQARTNAFSELYVKAYHFCVLYFDKEGRLMVDAWSDKVELIDRFEIENR